ncbi:hypothetical protein [Myxococcus phage Mx1]|nr:hypothetical protein [Myxococcus phage Mx1]
MDGIYRIYKLRHTEDGQTHRKLAARLFIHEGQVHHLEDHHDMDRMFPEGPFTPQLQRRMRQLASSGYHQVVDEAHIAQGHHPELVEQLDIGPIQAEHRFLMTGANLPNPQLVELWDHAVVLDGRRLEDDEAHQLLQEVAVGRLTLTPLDE